MTLISERLCYDSQQTFTREFRKHTGYTPLPVSEKVKNGHLKTRLATET
ncbi:AraC family transcriptional regulator [Escherichia coli]